MSDEKNVRQLREGHQPSKDSLSRGYTVTQPVDTGKLKIPSNLGSAAVTPSQPNSATIEPKN